MDSDDDLLLQLALGDRETLKDPSTAYKDTEDENIEVNSLLDWWHHMATLVNTGLGTR